MIDLLLLLSPLVYAVLLALLAFAAGGSVARRLVDGSGELPAPSAPMEGLGFALASGLGILGQTLFVLGALGSFHAGALALVAAIALGAGWRFLPARAFWRAGPARAPTARPSAGAVPPRVLGILAALAVAGPCWLALYPPVTWDDTIYHLPLARSLVEHGRYLFVENLRTPVFPLLAETLYAPALLLGRASTAHGLSLLATFATALLLLAWGHDRFAASGARSGSSVWAIAPAAIWIGQPIVVFYAGSSYVDPLSTLFVTAAGLAFERWRRDARPVLLIAAGAFAGWAAATKYLGLYPLAALALAILWQAGRGQRLLALLRFAGAAALTGGPWYLLIWWLAGNPLFPFPLPLFGESPWSEYSAIARIGTEAGRIQQAIVPLRLGWDLVVDRARVGMQPPASPLVVLALPLLLYLAWRKPWARTWVGIIAGFVLAFLALPRDARYLMFFAPVLSILLVAALRDLAAALAGNLAGVSPAGAGRPSSTLAAGTAVSLVVFGLASGPAYALWRTLRIGPPPVEPAAIDAFLARRLPLYRALLFRRDQSYEEVPVYALRGERLHDFAGKALLGDWMGPYGYRHVEPLLDRPEALERKLREFGAGQLLLPRALVPSVVVDGLVASRCFRELYRDDEGVLLALTDRERGAADSGRGAEDRRGSLGVVER